MQKKHSIKIVLSLLFLIPFNIFSQGEGSNWFFGDHSGLSFDMSNNYQPSSIAGVLPMSHREGVSSVSRGDGTLLFYTDGVRVYDQTNTIVGPVLLGNNSSSQSAVAFADPAGGDNYYIFTCDIANGTNGVNYYSVNTTGGVVTVNPNATALNLNAGYATPQSFSNSEKLTAIKKCDAIGYWLLTMNSNGDYLVYDVSATGVSFHQLYQANTIFPAAAPVRAIIGYLKFSPNGTRIVNTMSSGTVDIFNFNNATGIMSGSGPGTPLFRYTALPLQLYEPYGCEFSSNGNFLYVSCLGVLSGAINNPPTIVRYNMTTQTQEIVYVGDISSNFGFGALQMGLDGRIYLAKEERSVASYGSGTNPNVPQTTLGVISNPSATNLADVSFDVAGFALTNGQSKIGLPNFPADFFYSVVEVVSPVCPDISGTAVATPFSRCGGPYQFDWRRNNILFETDNNVPNGISVTKTGLTPGDYSVTITSNNGGIETRTFVIDERPADVFSSTLVFENPKCPEITGRASVTPHSVCGGPFQLVWRNDEGILFTDNNVPSGIVTTRTGLAPGNYSVTVINQLGESEVLVFVIDELNEGDCCPALRGVDPSHVTTYNANMVISNNLMWDNKIYISDGVVLTIDGATLDITNVDVVFGECAGIDFINGAVVRANNSVFRPCDINGKWRGIRFLIDGVASSGMFNECTFKNANKAIEVNYIVGNKNDISLRISNNLFANCQHGVFMRMRGGVFTRGITGNTFMVEEEAPEFGNTNACYTNIANDGRRYGIFANHVLFDDVIGENDFISNNFADRFVGAYVLNSDRVKIINNNYDNNWVSVYLNSTDGSVVERNKINIGSAYRNYNGQIIIGWSNYVRIIHNSIYNSSTNNRIGVGRSAKSAIYLKASSIINVKENEISAFQTGIDLREVRISNISENKIDNCWRYGVYMESPFDLDIACNFIKMEYNDNNNAPIGIAAYYPVWDNLASGSISNPTLAEQTKIKGNCIMECNEAVHIENNSGTQANTPVSPSIVNNYLYNYLTNGVNLMYMNTAWALGTGLTQQSAGRNTFTSNNIAGGAFDINTIGVGGSPIVISNGNFGVSSVSANVQIIGNGMYNSTASCANQIGVVNNQITGDQICDQLTGNEKLFAPPVRSNMEVSTTIDPYYEPTTYISEAVSVSESHFELFPNPAKATVKMTLNSSSEENLTVNVYSIEGKLIKIFNLLGHNIQFSFDVSDLIPGLYFIKLEDRLRIISQQKLVVVK